MPTNFEHAQADTPPSHFAAADRHGTDEHLFRSFAAGLQSLVRELLDEPDRARVDCEQLLQEIQQLRDDRSTALEEELAGRLGRLEEKLDALLEVDETEGEAAVVETESAPSSDACWQLERALLGEALAEDEELADDRKSLIEGLLLGESTASALAGQLLLFQSAPAERMPQILTDLGEAYYQWQPKSKRQSAAATESAIAAWLNQRCREAKVPNTIELVQPGDRFDSLLHTSDRGGNEVTEVFGWVITRRGSDRPFARAKVAVR